MHRLTIDKIWPFWLKCVDGFDQRGFAGPDGPHTTTTSPFLMSVEQLLSTCTVPTTWTLLSFESLIFLRELEFEDYGQLTRCLTDI
jgi:hypothetical protein